jgi:hypothetical protein
MTYSQINHTKVWGFLRKPPNLKLSEKEIIIEINGEERLGMSSYAFSLAKGFSRKL